MKAVAVEPAKLHLVHDEIETFTRKSGKWRPTTSES